VATADKDVIARLFIQFLANTEGVPKAMRDITSSMDDTAKKAQSSASLISKAWTGLKDNWMAASAAIYGAIKGIEKAMETIQIGAQAEAVGESFSILTKSMGIDGDALIEKLKEVSGTFVEDTELMIRAQRLLVEGLSSAEIVKLMEAARIASRLMGKSVEESFNLISESVIKLQTRGLKAAFPMDITDVVKKFADKLMSVPDLMTDAGKRAAVLGEILGQAADKGTLLGDSLSSPTNYEKIQKFKSAISALKEEVGKFLLSLAEGNLTPITDFVKKLIELVGGVKELGQAFPALGPIIKLAFDTGVTALQALSLGVTTIISLIVKTNTTLLRSLDAVSLGASSTVKKALVDSMTLEMALDKINANQSKNITEGVFGKEKEKAKTKAVFGEGEGKSIEKALIDIAALEEKVNKIRLDQEAKLSQGMADQATALVEKKKNIEITGAIERFRELSVIEDKFAVEAARARYLATIGVLKAQEAAEIAAVEKEIGKNEQAQQAIGIIRKTYLQQRQNEALKMDNEIDAVSLKRAKERADAIAKASALEGLATEYPTEEQTIAMDARSIEAAKSKVKEIQSWRQELQESLGNQESITKEMLAQLDIEMQQRIELGGLSAAEEDLLKTLTEAKKNRLEMTRAIESQKITISYQKQLADMTGDWKSIWEWEAASIENERIYIQLTTNLTDKQRELVNVVYQRKQVEAEAMKEMNIGLLSQIGMQKYNVDTNRQLAESWGKAIPDSIDAGFSAVKGALDGVADGTTTLTQGFKNMGISFVKAIGDMIISLILLAAKMQVINLLKSSFPSLFPSGGGAVASGGGGEFGWGGLWQNFDVGGKVLGGSGLRDDVPILAKRDEFIHPQESVRFYGEDIMEKLRRREIPASVFSQFRSNLSAARPGMFFATGGMVGGQIGPGGKIKLDLEIVTEPGFHARFKSTPEEIDLVVATKYKTGGHIQKAIKER
jgi:hypothetical protein